MEDNPYIVHLAPDELHELLSEYENYYEWCHNKLDTRQQALADRVLEQLRQADATHVCIDEDQSTQAKQFTRDDVARISARTVNAVLEKVSEQQIVEGIAVLPLGDIVGELGRGQKGM